MNEIAVILAPGFEEVEALTQIDFLRRADIPVVLAGIEEKDIVGGHNIRISADTTVDSLPAELDGVILPGGMPGAVNIAENQDAIDLVTELYEKGKMIAAICAAPGVVLGKTDILKKRRFTCYPGFEERVYGAVFSEDRVVVDGNVITSRGPGTAAEMACTIIEYLTDKQTADKIFKATLQKEC
ncbi:MAG: DJ-1 family glyoxalase III [Spirochaetia bacterium]